MVARVIERSCKCTFYLATIVYAEINISKYDGPADAVVRLGNSTQGSDILNPAVSNDVEDEFCGQACEGNRLVIIHVKLYVLLNGSVLLDQNRFRSCTEVLGDEVSEVL